MNEKMGNKMSESKKLNIYQKLNAVMSEVKYIQKKDKTFNKMYSYVSHDDVAAAIQPQLVKHGIALVSNVADVKQDGNRTSIVLEISFINIDDPKDQITVNFPGYGIDTQDKGIGKAISYAFKYCLLKTFCLETGDDVEKDSIDYKPQVISQQQLDYVEKLLSGQPARRKELLKFLSKEYKIYTVSELPLEIYEKVIKTLENPIEEEKTA